MTDIYAIQATLDWRRALGQNRHKINYNKNTQEPMRLGYRTFWKVQIDLIIGPSRCANAAATERD